MDRNRLTVTLASIGLVVAFVSPVMLAHYLESGSGGRREPAKTPSTSDRAVAGLESRQILLQGEMAFIRNCGMCHGFEAVGKVGIAPSLSNPDFLALASDSFIRKTVREGRLGTAMAPRRDISNDDLTKIIAYLRSLPGRDVKPVALDLDWRSQGDPENGRDNFARYCSSCHGAHGAGYAEYGTAPGIALPGFLRIAPDDYIFQTIARGRRGTPMRSFLGSQGLANLTRQEIGDIIVFLRQQDPALTPQFSEHLGEETFDRNCANCHQKGARGLVGVAPSLSSPEFLALASDDMIRNTVRRGRLGTTMVPRSDLTEWELDAILQYLRSLPTHGRREIAVANDRRSEGDGSRGRHGFATYCAPCHGPRGEGYTSGGSGPGIGLPGFLATVADDYIFQTVKYGRTGTPMRPFFGPNGLAQLQEQDIHDIIVFLRGGTSGL